ncbi:TetR/AcrR family transcriptional regulator C-terminal domain-containing protein [Tsukamurella tyrosinosolvens]|uniref:TetR/AcrR family transcriptional regulator C-terminal domain-containing protein n=1 Tax=Tsukamurella tyrosinosolvens TaxID=57704 RepID=UPI000CA11004|nr:TetR/AcrR family transcriptional regulator C-terminal domain-containing protein [Tsukamurella tyrosinosolvens]AUN42752.1 tetracycline repressor [Tsukamurella tyrosinosolvens]
MSRRVGRPSTPQLDRASIGAAALALVDREGALSMPALARRLGVQVSSIYHHVEGRAGVIGLVRDLVTADIDATCFATEPWDRALDTWARTYRTAFAAHPAAVRLLATETIGGRQNLAMYAAATAGLLRAGFRVEQVMGIVVGVENFLLGAALDVSAPEVPIALDDDGDDPAATDDLRRALAAAPSGPERSLQAFDLGLAALIEGLRALLVAEQQSQ